MFAHGTARFMFVCAIALLAIALLFGLQCTIPARAQTPLPTQLAMPSMPGMAVPARPSTATTSTTATSIATQAQVCPGMANPAMTGHTMMLPHGMMGQGMMMHHGRMMGRGMSGMMGQGMVAPSGQSCPLAGPSATGVITGSATKGPVTESATDPVTVPAKLSDLLKTASPQHGQQLTAANGCTACHSTDAIQRMVGPTWHDLATTAATRVSGQSAADYLYTSIVRPNAALAPGYAPNIMPQNFGQLLGEQDLADIVSYLLTMHE